MLGQPTARTESVQTVPSAWPRLAAIICGVGVAALPLALPQLFEAASSATPENKGSARAASEPSESDAFAASVASEPAASASAAVAIESNEAGLGG
jgi:hypothetical protein